MLNSLREEKRQLERRLETVEEREETLKAWLAEEQPAQRELEIPEAVTGGTPLSVFLRGVLADSKPHSLQEITKRVVDRGGLIRENVTPGRAVHFALIGLQQRHYVRRNKDGTWVEEK